MAGQVLYNYSSLEQGVSSMKRVNQMIEQKVSDLKQQVTTLLGDFLGSAAQGYETCAQKIQQNLTESNAKLATLTGKLGTSASDMRDEDTRQGANF